MKTIKEHMDTFQKQMCSHPKPLEMWVGVVEELLREIQRQRTVMRAGLEELDKHWAVVSDTTDVAVYDELVTLMDNLGSKRKGFYPQYLLPEEYEEFIEGVRSAVDFSNLAEEEAATDGEEKKE